MLKLARSSKLVAYKCNSCGEIQKESKNCEQCGYKFFEKVSVTRKEYCKHFHHLIFRDGDKKLTSSWDCCTENYTYRCKRCGVKVKDSKTNNFGCMLHGSLG